MMILVIILGISSFVMFVWICLVYTDVSTYNLGKVVKVHSRTSEFEGHRSITYYIDVRLPNSDYIKTIQVTKDTYEAFNEGDKIAIKL